ncbi:MAG: hypothetical protein LBU85_06110 [Treponema sp.]|jgi:hypothetical protein|nr:hypothetical protein [Treponema sp.]
MRTDYIPRPDEQFDTFFKLLIQYVGTKTSGTAPAWTHIPQPRLTAINADYGAWYDAFARTFKPHSSVETNEKNRVRLEVERSLRAFVNQFLRFPPVTDMDRDAMRIPNRDLIRTPHIEVTETVEFELVLRGIREVLVNFWIKGATHRAKPAGYDGAVIIWDVLDAPPSGPHDLTLHTMASKTPHAIQFEEEERGRTVYIAAAWQNERGNIGQWSEILSAVVP